jgi:hypothetical protein
MSSNPAQAAPNNPPSNPPTEPPHTSPLPSRSVPPVRADEEIEEIHRGDVDMVGDDRTQPPNTEGARKKWTKHKTVTPETVKSVLEYLGRKHITIDSLLMGLFEARQNHRQQWAAVKKVITDPSIVSTWTIPEQTTILETIGWSSVHRELRKEVLALTRTPQFGKFNPENVEESITAMVNEKELQRLAPHLVDIIYQACEPLRTTTRKNPNKVAAIVLSTLCHSMQRQNSNSFPLHLSIFLHREGLSRSGIETLCALGITSSYDLANSTLLKLAVDNKEEVRKIGEAFTAIVNYDNINWTNNVQDQRDGDTSKFISATTGVVHTGYRMPEGGLMRSEFKPTYVLKASDILSHGEPLKKQEKRRDDVRQSFHYSELQ